MNFPGSQWEGAAEQSKSDVCKWDLETHTIQYFVLCVAWLYWRSALNFRACPLTIQCQSVPFSDSSNNQSYIYTKIGFIRRKLILLGQLSCVKGQTVHSKLYQQFSPINAFYMVSSPTLMCSFTNTFTGTCVQRISPAYYDKEIKHAIAQPLLPYP